MKNLQSKRRTLSDTAPLNAIRLPLAAQSIQAKTFDPYKSYAVSSLLWLRYSHFGYRLEEPCQVACFRRYQTDEKKNKTVSDKDTNTTPPQKDKIFTKQSLISKGKLLLSPFGRPTRFAHTSFARRFGLLNQAETALQLESATDSHVKAWAEL